MIFSNEFCEFGVPPEFLEIHDFRGFSKLQVFCVFIEVCVFSEFHSFSKFHDFCVSREFHELNAFSGFHQSR